jgi:hypothetical protein
VSYKSIHEWQSQDKQMEKMVYLVRANGIYKIGVSKNVGQRVKEIRSKVKCPVELIHSFPGWVSAEGMLHKMYENQRLKGEWFDLTNVDVQEIMTIREHKDVFELWREAYFNDKWANLTP